jgi:hypothetical protein
MEQLGRPLVSSPITPLTSNSTDVLNELLTKLRLALTAHKHDSGALVTSEDALALYYQSRWFGERDEQPLEKAPQIQRPTDITVTTDLMRHSELGGGLLAGCQTACLTSVSTVVLHPAT